MTILMLWKPGPQVTLEPAQIAQEIEWGEDVEGLVDLPIREILDRIQRDFAGVEEKAGLLTRAGDVGLFEVTWGWQFIRFEWDQVSEADRQKIEALARELGCYLFERRETKA